MVSTSLIDLENVQVSHGKDMFRPSQLNAMAETISELGGVLNPLIVIRTGVETVQIIDGHLSYWAQVQAYEKTQNPDISMIRVFILTKDQLNTALKKQLPLIRSLVSYSTIWHKAFLLLFINH